VVHKLTIYLERIPEKQKEVSKRPTENIRDEYKGKKKTRGGSTEEQGDAGVRMFYSGN